MSVDLNLAEAMRSGTKLLETGEYEKALKLLDQAIMGAIGTGENSSWISTVCNHVAVVADFAGHHDFVKHYYEQLLDYDSENSRAFYGLAKFYLDQKEAQTANGYSTKCYEVIMRSSDRKGKELLELITKRWPELGA